MSPELLTRGLLPIVFVLAGIAMVFVKVDPDALRANVHTWPSLALARFRAVRYGAAVMFFMLAAVAYFSAG